MGGAWQLEDIVGTSSLLVIISRWLGIILKLEAWGTIGVIFFSQIQEIWTTQSFTDNWLDVNIQKDDIKTWLPVEEIQKSKFSGSSLGSDAH